MIDFNKHIWYNGDNISGYARGGLIPLARSRISPRRKLDSDCVRSSLSLLPFYARIRLKGGVSDAGKTQAFWQKHRT